jgi:MFS family permease
MNKLLHRLHVLSVSLGLVAAIGFVYNSVILGLLFPKIERFDPIGTQWETAGIVVGVSLFMIADFHLASVLTLLLRSIQFRAVSWRVAALLVLGILSGILILADVTMLQEIGKQYAQGWHSTGEWIILFTSTTLHALFIGLGLSTLLANLRAPSSSPDEPMLRDHVVFQLTHLTGFLCGALGTAAWITAVALRVPTQIVEKTVITLGSLILMPYFLILMFWLWSKRKDFIRDWFDEKQMHDLAKASLGTLFVTPPAMILLYLLQVNLPNGELWSLLWLPAYLFLTLLTFSAGTLLLSKQ